MKLSQLLENLEKHVEAQKILGPSVNPKSWELVDEFLLECNRRDPRYYEIYFVKVRPGRKQYREFIWNRYYEIFGLVPDKINTNIELIKEAVAVELQYMGFVNHGQLDKLTQRFLEKRENLKLLNLDALTEYERFLITSTSFDKDEEDMKLIDEELITTPIKVLKDSLYCGKRDRKRRLKFKVLEARAKRKSEIKPKPKVIVNKVALTIEDRLNGRGKLGITSQLSFDNAVKKLCKEGLSDEDMSVFLMIDFPSRATSLTLSRIRYFKRQYAVNSIRSYA